MPELFLLTIPGGTADYVRDARQWVVDQFQLDDFINNPVVSSHLNQKREDTLDISIMGISLSTIHDSTSSLYLSSPNRFNITNLKIYGNNYSIDTSVQPLLDISTNTDKIVIQRPQNRLIEYVQVRFFFFKEYIVEMFLLSDKYLI